jgi:hypothetical protein
MPSALHTFTLFWRSRLLFFLDPRTSPRRRLDWDTQNADGTPLPLGYGAEDFRRPRRFFNKRSDGASIMLAFGYDTVGGGVPGPQSAPQADGFLRLWLATFATSAGFRIFLESVLPPPRYLPAYRLPVVDFRSRVSAYPRAWPLDEIAHQHFLACAWLSFWCIEERGPADWPIRVFWLRRTEHNTMPSIFDELLDRMALSFETSFDAYCQSRRDHIREDRLRNHLFRVVASTFYRLECLGSVY